jgi:hypothetical protein
MFGDALGSVNKGLSASSVVALMAVAAFVRLGHIVSKAPPDSGARG